MTDDAAPPTTETTSKPVTPPHEPPEGRTTTLSWTNPDGNDVEVTATAAWTVIRAKDERPAAELFHVSYVVGDGDRERPVTFVFNGGPGAASAYLHVGVVGPRRIDFPDDGTLPTPPPRLVDNEQSWLAHTDLVFIDPVGTGYSRVIPGDKDAGDSPDFHTFGMDVSSLGELMTRWLSTNDRWGSPVHIAGESYGGYRVARMARTLQEEDGIALSGAMLISPALEFAPLSQTGYDVSSWIDRVPTMAAAAVHHGRCRVDGDLDEVVARAIEFAAGDYATFLVRGASMPPDQRDGVMSRLADLIGLDVDVVRRFDGRVTYPGFVRELLRDEGRAVGLYDATITARDPFPDREPYAGPDLTLAGIGPAFTTAVNQVLSGELGVTSDRRYRLLAMDVNLAWKGDEGEHALEGPRGATDDLRYGMALNPALRVYVCHGQHDMITPWFTSRRLIDLMRLDDETDDRVTFDVFDGGHMFYTRADSRTAFAAAIARHYAS